MYDDASVFMNKTIQGKQIFENQWNSLLTKSSLFKELREAGGAERNKELLITRAVASIRELYEKVMTPYLRNKAATEKWSSNKIVEERDRLISMIQI